MYILGIKIGFFLSIAIIIFLVTRMFLFGEFTPRPQGTEVPGNIIWSNPIEGPQYMIPPGQSLTALADCPTGTVLTGVGHDARGTVVLRVSFDGSQAKVDAQNTRQDASSTIRAIAFCARTY